MNRTLIITLAVLAGLGVLSIGIFGITYMSVNNSCVKKETGLKATKQESQSVYDNFWKKVKEVAQVPQEYNKGMAETYAKIMDARYKNSTKVMMNWITEANPNFDSSMYKQVQQVIESGRNDFQHSQMQMIDKARDYREYVQTMPTSFFVRLAGWPSPDFKWDDYKPLTSDETENAFKTGKDKVLNVFDKGDSR